MRTSLTTVRCTVRSTGARLGLYRVLSQHQRPNPHSYISPFCLLEIHMLEIRIERTHAPSEKIWVKVRRILIGYAPQDAEHSDQSEEE